MPKKRNVKKVKKKRKKRKERRSRKYGSPTSQTARDLGRRQRDFRELKDEDKGKIIDRNWLENLKETAKNIVGYTMQFENVNKDEAIRRLRQAGHFHGRSFFKEVGGETREYMLRFSFKDGKIFWSSTRRGAHTGRNINAEKHKRKVGVRKQKAGRADN